MTGPAAAPTAAPAAAPAAAQTLLDFLQHEASESLNRLDRLMAGDESVPPDAGALLTHARALHGTIAQAGLEGMAELAATIERIGQALRVGELRWAPRLHLAVRESLAEMRGLVMRARAWSPEAAAHSQREARALTAVATAHVASTPPVAATAGPPMQPISRLHPEDGMPGIVQRNPAPPMSIAQRFRLDMAHAGGVITQACERLEVDRLQSGHAASLDALRHALLTLRDVADSYSAASLVSLATTMAQAPLATPTEWAAVHAVGHLLMRRDLSNAQLAAQVREAAQLWAGAPLADGVQVVPIESLLYRGRSAVARAREVRDALRVHWQRGTLADPDAHALYDELSDLLDLAVST